MNRTLVLAAAVLVAGSVSVAAQWPKTQDPSVPRDAQGRVRYDAPPPRTADGKIDFSGVWARANSGAPGRGRGRGGAGAPGAPGGRAGNPGGAPAAGEGIGQGGRGGVSLEPSTAPFPVDPNGPPVATFFEAGGNMEGGLPYTPWAKGIRDARLALNARDNPDAMCLPMGFLQFHQQPQPRKIYQTPKEILIEYEANYGLRHIYLDGRKLPPQGEPQPFWYGYSVGRWEGDTLVVETNNVRAGTLDRDGVPYSDKLTAVERIRRVSPTRLEIETTLTDPEAFLAPFTIKRAYTPMPAGSRFEEYLCENNRDL